MKCDILNGTWQWPSNTYLLYDNADFLHSISCCSVSSPDPVTTFLRVMFGRRREKRGVTRWWRAGGGLRITDSWTMRYKPSNKQTPNICTFSGQYNIQPSLVTAPTNCSENHFNCRKQTKMQFLYAVLHIDWVDSIWFSAALYFET